MKNQRTLRNNTVTIKSSEMDRWLAMLLWVMMVPNSHKPYYNFLNRIKATQSHTGNQYVVKYLKEANRIVMCWFSGEFVNESIGIRVGIAQGLPRIIPGPLRILIRKGDRKVLRVVLTILSLYRIMECDSVLKLSTITKPFLGLTKSLPSGEIWHIHSLRSLKINSFKLKMKHITSAGTNHPISTLSAPFDAIGIVESSIYDSFVSLGLQWGLGSLVDALKEEYQLVKGATPFRSAQTEHYIGKLSLKQEAAGKVRVFAITDWWTQNLLYPLHVAINDLLKSIEQDGTFDQVKPLKILTSRLGSSFRVSYDLSAATDRLPIDLQIDVLSTFIGLPQAKAWANLLVGRDWVLQGTLEKLRYAVGQPMGAYSSFAMLALTHHFIVQIAAVRAYPKLKVWFKDYALLGDDIVIADNLVSTHYLYIMRETLGVEINLSKSLESAIGVAEFAKRLISPEIEVTPIGPKVILQSVRDANLIPTLITDVISKGVDLDFNAIELMFSKNLLLSQRVKSFTWSKVLWTILAPFGKVPSDRLLPLLMSSNSYTPKELKKFYNTVSLFVMQEWHRKDESGSKAVYAAWKSYLNDLRKSRGVILPETLSSLPSTKFLLNLYQESSKFKNDDLKKKVWDFFLAFSKGKMESMDILPSLLEEPRKSLLNFEEVDERRNNVEVGKTAFKLIRKLHLEMGVPSVVPFVRKNKRTSSPLKDLKLIRDPKPYVSRRRILFKTY